MSDTIALRVGREDPTYDYQVGPASTVQVDAGDRVVFSTHDARAGAFADVTAGEWFDLPKRSPAGRSDPLSGPVYVRGAEPGDSLVVQIEQIVVDARGWCGGRPVGALDAGRIPESRAIVCEIERDSIRFSDRIQVAAVPMVGCIGTAPAGEPMPSENPGRNGGNLDQNVIRAGARVHLPVAHPGGYLFLGDVHAAQGDGELSGIGLEIGAETTVRVDVVKGSGIAWPWVELDDKIMVLVSAAEFTDARREAMECMLAVLESQLQLTSAQALALLSIAGDLRIGQACGGFDLTVRLEMPASLGLRPA